MQRGSAVLHGCADASALQKGALKHLNTRPDFSTESLLELFRFVQSTSADEEAFCVKEKPALQNLIAKDGVATVDKRKIEEGNARYTSAMRLHQEHLKEDGACVCVANRRTLLDVWH